MTVAACIIVKDEWEDLQRCLRSLTGKVDQVLVGFTDREMFRAHHKEARSLIPEVIYDAMDIEWTDDFAETRNCVAKSALFGWWFYIDADEALEGDIRRLCDQLPDDMDGCLIPVNNLVSDDGQEGVIGSTAEQFRLVRNRIGARFEGRIHEQIVLPDGRLPRVAHVTGLSITHWGYLPERAKGKHIRNLTLLRHALEDEPESPYYHFQMGVQHASAEDFPEAIGAFQTAIRLWQAAPKREPFVPALFTSAIMSCIRDRQFELAVKIAGDAPVEAFTPDYFYYTALASLECGMAEEAHGLLVRARQAKPDPHYHDPNTANRIEVALEKMG